MPTRTMQPVVTGVGGVQQPRYAPSQQAAAQQVQQPQQSRGPLRFGGGGKSGGGGGRQGGGPRNYGPKELAAIFRKLRDASGQLFTNKTEFLITEQSAHILLTETFDLLAKATTRDRLTE